MSYDRTAAIQDRIPAIARDLFDYDETLKSGADMEPVPFGWAGLDDERRAFWLKKAATIAEAAENIEDCLPLNHGLDVNGLAIAALRAVPNL